MKNFSSKHSRSCRLSQAALMGATSVLVGANYAHSARPGSGLPLSPPASPTVSANSGTVALVPYDDPWKPDSVSSYPRYLDMSSNSSTATKRSNTTFYDWWDGQQGYFNYSENVDIQGNIRPVNVTVTYDKAPSAAYFVGRIDATGLKPNFCYQIKLTGKPRYSNRGWGPYNYVDGSGVTRTKGNGGGEDWANWQLGKVARWWCDSHQSDGTHFNDTHYSNTYQNDSTTPTHDIYGFIFVGDFITDGRGEAHVNFTGRRSYHITLGGWQPAGAYGTRNEQDRNTPFAINGFMDRSSPLHYYGYGSKAPAAGTSVTLYYEYELPGKSGPSSEYIWPRPANTDVRLPNGQYRCRMLITEESFHSDYWSNPVGGYWLTSMIADSDIVFNIGNVTPPAAPVNVKTAAANGQVTLTWSDPQETGGTHSVNRYYNITRQNVTSGTVEIIAGGVKTGLNNATYNYTYVDKTVTTGNTYTYSVSAVDSGVEGPASVADVATNPAATATP